MQLLQLAAQSDPGTIPGVLRINVISIPCSLYAYALNSLSPEQSIEYKKISKPEHYTLGRKWNRNLRYEACMSHVHYCKRSICLQATCISLYVRSLMTWWAVTCCCLHILPTPKGDTIFFLSYFLIITQRKRIFLHCFPLHLDQFSGNF